MNLADFMTRNGVDPNNVEDLEVIADFLSIGSAAKRHPSWRKEFYEMALDTAFSAVIVAYQAYKMGENI